MKETFIEAQRLKSDGNLVYSGTNDVERNESLIDFSDVEKSINEVELCI